MCNQPENKVNLESIIQHFEKKDVVIKLLRHHEISDLASIESIERYSKDANRAGVTIISKGECSCKSEKILLDFKLGEPCIDQVFDAIYTNGKDCSKRIVMFGGTAKDDATGPATDEYAVGSLIANMKDFPLNLYYVQLNWKNLDTQLYDMDLVGGDFLEPMYPMSNLPSEEKFREAEFWDVYFDSINDGFYESWRAFECGIHKDSKYGWKVLDSELEVKLQWNNQGAFFTIIQSDDESDRLKELWQTKEDQFRQLFPDNEIKLIYLPGKLPKIAIEFWNIPLNTLVCATNAEKMNFAKSLHSKLSDLASFVGI